MLAVQIASGLLLAAFVVLMGTKGMAIHRAEDGWKGTFGAMMFLAAMIAGGAIVIAGALADVPY